MRCTRRYGFTLIELSVVLVIVGLLVGGILLGADLIKAAEIRWQVSQVQEIRTAVATFRGRYAYLPGDMPSQRALQFGFFAETVFGGSTGRGDANGLIEGSAPSSFLGLSEVLAFWRHLTDAELIVGSYGTTAAGNPIDPNDGSVTTPLVAGTVGQVFPPARIGRGNHLVAYSFNGTNYFQLTGITAMNVAGIYTLQWAMTPIEAQLLDQKLDDGMPALGTIRAMRSAFAFTALSFAGDGCTAAGGIYDTGSINAEMPNCQLRIRAGF